MKKIFTLFAALAMVMSMSAVPYLKGTFNGWGDSNSLSSGSTTVTLNANAVYDFKVNDGNTWYGNSGTMESTNCTDWTMSTSVQDNCKIKTTIAGVYTFKWDASSKKLSVVYPTEAVEINFYITGTSNLVGGDGWQANEIKMTNNDGTYTHTFTALAAGNYEMKITQGDWSNTLGFSNLAAAYVGVTGNNDNNIVMALTETTNLTVTVTGTTVSLNLPEKTNTVYFVNETDWSKVHAYVWANDPYKPWPGEAMTKVEGKTYNGKDVYTYTYPANCSNVIFNDGSGNQTSDLTYSEATPYYYNSKWNASIEYDKTTYTVTVTATVNPAETGTVAGAGKYEEGKEATLTATPAEGYQFVNWTVGDSIVSTENPYKFTVTADLALVANFKKSVVTHDFYVEDVTVTEGQWSIDLAGSWNEQAFVLKLWQDNTQGFGTYAANAETGYSAQLGVKDLTPTAPGYYTDMQDGTFTFQGTMTDGTDIYEVFLKGALASGTGEMEAKTEVAFSCDADGVWSIEAFADDNSWGLMLEVVPNLETGEYVATGYYITDIEAGVNEEVAGTGMLYFDDLSGCQVFKGNLTTESGNIYPTLYASSLSLMTNELMTGASWVGEFAGVDYYEVLMMAADYSWKLDLHARNCTGANGTYTVDVVDEAEGAYSTFMGNTIVTGELTIEDGMYEANVTTVDSEGNPAMSISVSAWEAEAAEYNVVIENATVTKNNAGYNIDLTGEWDGHDIKVEVCDELTAETILANFFIDGGIANDGDQAEGTVEATVNEGVVTITGTFECLGSGAVYNVTISGTLPVEEDPEGPATGLENLTTTVAPVKMIENGQLIIMKGDAKYNVQGAVVK